MSFLRRKQRDWAEIAKDARTPYMVGRLLGANEMAVVLLRLEDNETAKNVANVLEKVSGYFMEDVAAATSNAALSSESDTWHGQKGTP